MNEVELTSAAHLISTISSYCTCIYFLSYHSCIHVASTGQSDAQKAEFAAMLVGEVKKQRERDPEGHDW